VPLLLQYVDGYTSGEIGEMLGIPAATVRTRVFEACRRLRRALSDDQSEGA
jgi:DNA-directed RNA polymerase specialized sigma24 family protein